MQALVTAARAEKSSTVQRSYAQAAATVAKYSSENRVAKLVEEAVTMYTTPGDAFLLPDPSCTPPSPSHSPLTLLYLMPSFSHSTPAWTPCLTLPTAPLPYPASAQFCKTSQHDGRLAMCSVCEKARNYCCDTPRASKAGQAGESKSHPVSSLCL